MTSVFVVTVTEAPTEGEHPKFPYPFVISAESVEIAMAIVCRMIPDDTDAEVSATRYTCEGLSHGQSQNADK